MRVLRIAFLCAVVAVLFSFGAKAQWNDATQQFTPGSGQVVFYDNYLCKGEPYMVLQRGRTYNDFRSYNLGALGTPNWNDKTSCVVVGPGTKVTIYEHINFGGKSATFGRTTSNPNGMWSFQGIWWNNQASSAKIF